MKWTYIAEDDEGRAYNAEAEVMSRFAWTFRTIAWAGICIIIMLLSLLIIVMKAS